MAAAWLCPLLRALALCAALALTPAEAAATGVSSTEAAELGKNEAEEYRHQFAQIDADADGHITAVELAKATSDSAEISRGTARAAEEPRDDRNEGIVRASEEQSNAPSKVPAEDPASGKSLAAHLAHGVQQQVKALLGQEFGKRDLVFVHVPGNFGQTVERVALEGNREGETPFILYGSFNAKTLKDQWDQINGVKGFGGQVWGQMSPVLRGVSNFTGCNLVYEPPKHWPSKIAHDYFGSGRAFGLLRDPYDRLVSEFRQQASGGSQQVADSKRSDISEREGSLEREGSEYQGYYSSCDVNGWVREEMRRYMAGDQFRGNCHLLPQAEYFKHPHGISLPIDARTIPDSFNSEMERHGYPIRMMTHTVRHSWGCNKLSAWDLDEESKLLIRTVYAADFELICRHFGYCDSRELTCLSQIPFMCGSMSDS